jgi:integrase
MKRYGRDTRTRWEGIYARHQVGCRVEGLPRDPTLTQISRACNCDPSYWGKAYDRAAGRPKKTKTYPTTAAARNARRALQELLEKGGVPREAPLRIRDARTRFIADADAGKALNKKGKRYTTRSLHDIDLIFEKHIVPELGSRRLVDVRRGMIQAIVNERAPKMSGSRVRGIVNAVHSLYRWARQNEFVGFDPAQGVLLPALDVTPRDRIATPYEMEQLLAVLKTRDAVPFALATYAWGRRSQVLYLEWPEVDLRHGLAEWGREADGARKSDAARHVVPLLRPVWRLLKAAWIEQGRPESGKVCPPRKQSKSGLLSDTALYERTTEIWEEAGLEPISLQECRHSAATWLDNARISPKTASVLMSHTIPDPQPGAAPITLRTYTHLMPEALEEARREMDAWIVAQIAKEKKKRLTTAR